MKVYEPKFRIRDNFIGKVLKVISILTFVGGIITGLGYMFDGEGGIGLIIWISDVITASFIMGFSEIIFLLEDIKYKRYEEGEIEEKV